MTDKSKSVKFAEEFRELMTANPPDGPVDGFNQMLNLARTAGTLAALIEAMSEHNVPDLHHDVNAAFFMGVKIYREVQKENENG